MDGSTEVEVPISSELGGVTKVEVGTFSELDGWIVGRGQTFEAPEELGDVLIGKPEVVAKGPLEVVGVKASLSSHVRLGPTSNALLLPFCRLPVLAVRMCSSPFFQVLFILLMLVRTLINSQSRFVFFPCP